MATNPTVPCKKCRGTGKVKKGKACARCKGSGVYTPAPFEEQAS